MSEFQTSLVVIGALVIVAVIAYNRWQEHRAGQAADESFRSRHPDVLIGAESKPESPAGIATGSATRFEPGLKTQLLFPKTAVFEPAYEAAPPVPVVDYVIALESGDPIGVAVLREHWTILEHRFARRAALSAAFDGEWGGLRPEGTWRSARVALQLVSRQGVVSEVELLEFRSGVESMASALGATAAAPEMRDALDAARALDAICAAADIQVAFHVVAAPGASFAGTKVRAAAEASGFLLDRLGRFTLVDEDGRELYALTDRSGAQFGAVAMKEAVPQALTLSMDVPRSPQTQRTFESMVRFGRHLATVLGGGLVDDNDHPLDERATATIGAQLQMVRENLEARGISPGSAIALRLFS